jgi:hypothetical protein
MRCYFTTASGPGYTSASGHTEDKSQGPLPGRWTGRDPVTTASGPGPHHRVRSCELGSRVNSDRTLSASGRARSLLDSDRTPLQRVRSGASGHPVKSGSKPLLTVHHFFSIFNRVPPSFFIPSPSPCSPLQPRRRPLLATLPRRCSAAPLPPSSVQPRRCPHLSVQLPFLPCRAPCCAVLRHCSCVIEFPHPLPMIHCCALTLVFT